jgi:predicted HTH transcriptional regulator
MSFDAKKYLSDENGLKQLCSDEVAEDANLDFKLESYDRKNPYKIDKIEACRDVASFANAGGPGYILIGVEEKNSVAVAVPGITGTEVQETSLRNVLFERIEPRIERITLRTIPLSNGSGVVVIEIPVCELNIYAVRIDKGRYEFWIRRDKKKAELSFTEIQYRLLADLESLRLRRKAEAISENDNVTVFPISVPSHYHKDLFEFKVASKDSSSINTLESTNYIITIPYDLIQTIYHDYRLGLKIICLLPRYNLIVDEHSKESQKPWKIMPTQT